MNLSTYHHRNIILNNSKYPILGDLRLRVQCVAQIFETSCPLVDTCADNGEVTGKGAGYPAKGHFPLKEFACGFPNIVPRNRSFQLSTYLLLSPANHVPFLDKHVWEGGSPGLDRMHPRRRIVSNRSIELDRLGGHTGAPEHR